MHNYLKRTKAPIPESLREGLPNYRAVSAVLEYSHLRDGDGKTLPLLESQITFVLIPKSGDGLCIKDACTIPGPQFPEHQHKKLVTEAKAILKDPQRLEEILLTPHLSSITADLK